MSEREGGGKNGGREGGREERKMLTYPKVGDPPTHPSKDLALC